MNKPNLKISKEEAKRLAPFDSKEEGMQFANTVAFGSQHSAKPFVDWSPLTGLVGKRKK